MAQETIPGSVGSYRIAMALLGTLFFMFGLVSWVNSILIPYFKVACELTHTQSYLVALSFYIAYLVMSLPASRLIGRVGHKKGIRFGLWAMAAGCLLFVPAAYGRTYAVFLAGLFTIGTGLAVLQTVANPYVTVIGPLRSAARRMSLMGLCNKVAGIIAPLLFAAVILKSTDSALFEWIEHYSVQGTEKEAVLDELIRRVIVPYSVLSAFLFLLGYVAERIDLPKLPVSPKKEEAGKGYGERKSVLAYPYLVLGVGAIFFHVAAQVISIDTIISYAGSMGWNLNEAKIFPSLTLACSLTGYFAGIILIPKRISQKRMFQACTVLGFLFSVGVLLAPGQIRVAGHTTELSIWFLCLMGFANALIYAGIWPLAIHDLGRWTDTGSSLMVMALCGNAFMPVIYGVLADRYGLRPAYIVFIPCFLYLLFYAFYGYKIENWKDVWKKKKRNR